MQAFHPVCADCALMSISTCHLVREGSIPICFSGLEVFSMSALQAAPEFAHLACFGSDLEFVPAHATRRLYRADPAPERA